MSVYDNARGDPADWFIIVVGFWIPLVGRQGPRVASYRTVDPDSLDQGIQKTTDYLQARGWPHATFMLAPFLEFIADPSSFLQPVFNQVKEAWLEEHSDELSDEIQVMVRHGGQPPMPEPPSDYDIPEEWLK